MPKKKGSRITVLEIQSLKIEKGVKCPGFATHRKTLCDVVEEMKAGDSVRFPNRTRAIGLYQAGKRAGVEMRIGRDGEGARVWRIS